MNLRLTKQTVIMPLIFIGVTVFLWQVLIPFFKSPHYLLPSPLDIMSSLFSNYEYIFQNLLVTLYEVFFGFVIGVLLIIVWFGYGILTKIMISALISFFPVLINFSLGLNNIDKNLVVLLRSLGATKTQEMIYVRFPNALPSIFSGMKISVTLSIVGAIIGEFMSASRGIGYVIMLTEVTQNISLMFAALIVLSITGILLFFIIHLLEKKIIFWMDLD